MTEPRFYFLSLFGDTVQIRIIDTLCNLVIKEKQGVTLSWINLSQIANQAQIAKSSVKRIIDDLLYSNYVIEKDVQTHAQTPPRFIRLNDTNPVVRELLFFYRKIRGFV